MGSLDAEGGWVHCSKSIGLEQIPKSTFVVLEKCMDQKVTTRAQAAVCEYFRLGSSQL